MAERGIRKTRAGRYEVRVYAGRAAGRDTQQRRVFDTLAEAKKWKRTMAGLRADNRDLPNDKISVGQYLQQWLDANKPVEGRPDASRWRETTFALYTEVIAAWVTPYLGHIRLARLTPSDLQRWHRTLLERGRHRSVSERGLSGTSVLNAHSILRRALRMAVRDGAILRNPAAADAMDSPKKPITRRSSSTRNKCGSCWPKRSGRPGTTRCTLWRSRRGCARANFLASIGTTLTC